MINRPAGSWITDTEGNITGPNLADEAMAAKFDTKSLGPEDSSRGARTGDQETAANDEGRE